MLSPETKDKRADRREGDGPLGRGFWLPVPWEWTQVRRLRFMHTFTVCAEPVVSPMGSRLAGTTTWAAMNADTAVHLTWEWVEAFDDRSRLDLRDPMTVRSNLRLFSEESSGRLYLDRMRTTIVLMRQLCEIDWQADVKKAL